MSHHNTCRAVLLAGLIALGSTVSSDAAHSSVPFLSAVQLVVIESAEIVSSIAQRGFEAIGISLRAP